MSRQMHEGGAWISRLSKYETKLIITVQPGASENKVIGLWNGALKIKIRARAVENAANKFCVEFLAEIFGIKKNKIRLVSGLKSRVKVIIVGESIERIKLKLGYLEN